MLPCAMLAAWVLLMLRNFALIHIGYGAGIAGTPFHQWRASRIDSGRVRPNNHTATAPGYLHNICHAGDKEAPGHSTETEPKAQQIPRPVANGPPPRPPGLEEPGKGGFPNPE